MDRLIGGVGVVPGPVGFMRFAHQPRRRGAITEKTAMNEDVLDYDPLMSGIFISRAMKRDLSRKELFYHTMIKQMRTRHYYEGILTARSNLKKLETDPVKSARLWNTLGVLYAQSARYMAERSRWADRPNDLRALEKTLLPENRDGEKAQLVVRHMQKAQDAFARAVTLSGGFGLNQTDTQDATMPNRAYLTNFHTARLEMLNRVENAQEALWEQSQRDATTRHSAMLQSVILMNQGMVYQREGDTRGFERLYQDATRLNGMMTGERNRFYYLLA